MFYLLDYDDDCPSKNTVVYLQLLFFLERFVLVVVGGRKPKPTKQERGAKTKTMYRFVCLLLRDLSSKTGLQLKFWLFHGDDDDGDDDVVVFFFL